MMVSRALSVFTNKKEGVMLMLSGLGSVGTP